jgi:hypothetical protein
MLMTTTMTTTTARAILKPLHTTHAPSCAVRSTCVRCGPVTVASCRSCRDQNKADRSPSTV